jgi:hypothetical protein
MAFKRMIFLIFLISLFPKNTKSQTPDHGYLKLRVSGGAPMCRIDSITFRASDTLIELSPGSHQLKMGLPISQLIDTSLTITANDTLKYNAVLQLSLKYIQYKKEYAAYMAKRNRRGFVSPIWMSLTIGAGILVNQQFAQKQYRLAMEAKDSYSRTGYQLRMDQAETDFYAYKKKYTNFRKIEYSFYGATALLFVNYVRILIKQKNTPVPLFKEENLFSRIQVKIFPDLETKNMFYGLTFRF